MDKFPTIAEAIECGAAMTKPTINRLQDFDGATCAVGAALVAIGKLPDEENLALLHSRFPQPLPTCCPVCHEDLSILYSKTLGYYGQFNLLTHLNDTHEWSREQIASWLKKHFTFLQGSSEAPLVNPIPGATTLTVEGAIIHLGCRLSGHRLRDRKPEPSCSAYLEALPLPKRHLASSAPKGHPALTYLVSEA